MFNVDAAVFQVKIAESFRSTRLLVAGSATQSYGSATALTTLQNFSGSVVGQLTVPVFNGGTEYALDPSGQGDAWPEADRSRYRARPNAS